MNTKSERTHDKLYLNEDRREQPKEYFKFIMENAKDYLDSLNKPKILDIGCATGDFLYYANQLYPEAIKYGMDVMDELLDRARLNVADANFIKGNIETGEYELNEKFDALFMSGVHGIFDEIEPVLLNVLKLLKDGGRAYVFGVFNPEPLDVIIRSRQSGEKGNWEKGWNLFSKKTVGEYLETMNAIHEFKEFKIGIEIEKNKGDCLRSWTINLENGEKMIVNGLQLVHPFYLLEIKNKSNL